MPTIAPLTPLISPAPAAGPAPARPIVGSQLPASLDAQWTEHRLLLGDEPRRVSTTTSAGAGVDRVASVQRDGGHTRTEALRADLGAPFAWDGAAVTDVERAYTALQEGDLAWSAQATWPAHDGAKFLQLTRRDEQVEHALVDLRTANERVRDLADALARLEASAREHGTPDGVGA